MKTRRTPFYGGPEDRHILGSMGDGTEAEPPPAPVDIADQVLAELHPEAEIIRRQPTEHGTEIALGFMPHNGENRQKRRAEVATWKPPAYSSPKVDGGGAVHETMPTRRELLKQRQNQRRGKLDPELRRLQKRKAAR